MKRLLPVLAFLIFFCTASAQGPYLTPFDFGLKPLEHGRIDYDRTPPNVLCGNFNADCYPDVARFTGNRLEIYFFQGQGYSACPQGVKTFSQPIKSLRHDDFPWDNVDNLVVVLQDGSEETFYHRGGCLDLRENQGFLPTEEKVSPPRIVSDYDFQVVWESEPYPFGFASCAVGDLDNDGVEELVSYWQEDSYSDTAWILIYKCTGDNQYELFMEECFNPDIGTESGASQMLIGDLDQNGQNELILTYDKCYFWEFSAPGVYTSWRSDFVFPRGVRGCRITDVDEDGLLEIAAVAMNSGLQPPTYYLVEEFQQKSNPPDSTIFFNTITWFSQNWEDCDMDVGDFDNDGAADMVSGNAGFVFGYDPVETQYFRYDETSLNPPNFRQYWLNPGIPLSCVNPIIADLDGDGANELYSGGLYPGGGSAFIWEGTGLQTGYVAWLDTVNSPTGPNESSFGYIDGEGSVAAVHIIPVAPSKSQLLLWAHSDSTYISAWQSAVQDCCFYSRPVVSDADHDGKVSIIEADYIYPQAFDWEQTVASISDLPGTWLAKNFDLPGAHPNPFNFSTLIQFNLGVAGATKLSIFNISGQIVYIRKEPFLPAGQHFWKWEAADLASGVYLISLQSGGIVLTRKGVLLK